MRLFTENEEKEPGLTGVCQRRTRNMCLSHPPESYLGGWPGGTAHRTVPLQGLGGRK